MKLEIFLQWTDTEHVTLAQIEVKDHPDHKCSLNRKLVKWDAGIQAMVYFLLGCARWRWQPEAQRSPSHGPELRGGRGTLAASFDNLMSSPKFRSLFDCSAYKQPHGNPLERAISRDNSGLKRSSEPVVFALEQAGEKWTLSPEDVSVFVYGSAGGKTKLENPAEIDRLAQDVKEQ